MKTEILLSWILDEKIDFETLKDRKVLKDGDISRSITKLRGLENKSKLRRIFESNLGLVEPYLSKTVYTLLLELKSVHSNGDPMPWQCMKCDEIFTDCSAWKCDRCLLWCHEKCGRMYPRTQRTHILCHECYT